MSLQQKHKSEYGAWVNMRHRCTNDKHPQFNDYGGRGISICNSWLNDFEQFLNDVGEKPSPELTLDRLDNDGNYEPGNVAWRSRSDQQKNRRQLITKGNRLITHNSETKPLEDWSRDTGIKRSTLQMRLDAGWTVADALTRPVRGYS